MCTHSVSSVPVWRMRCDRYILSSVYTLLLMSCVAIVVYVLCKINEHWNPDELYLVIAIRGNMSFRRLKQVQFFLLGMAFSGFMYSLIYLILDM